MEMEFVEMPADEVQPHRKALYSKPVVVLTSVGTASAAEDFCVSFKSINRGKFIGESTYGSTGQPLMLTLPGGGAARICTKHDTFPDGSEFVGVGVQPDIPVHQSIADFRGGVDTVLGAALHYFEGALGIKAR
jgi:C-terminal processing protease CtpA/Prc